MSLPSHNSLKKQATIQSCILWHVKRKSQLEINKEINNVIMLNHEISLVSRKRR